MDEGEKGPAGRVIALERQGAERRRVYVPLVRRKRRFLEALAACGNASMAREAAGLGKDRLYKARRADPGFAADWQAALAAFRASADSEEEMEAAGLSEAALDGEAMVIRRGRGGAPQVVRRRSNMWSRAKEALFLEAFAATASVTAASRAVGMSEKAGFERIRTNARFRAQVAEAKPAALDRVELMLMEHGIALLGTEDPQRRDPAIAMWLLKRRDQEAAGRLRRGRAWAREPSAEEVTAKIVRQVAAINRHRDRQRLAEGWSQDEAGNWIPPGWVREAPADGPGDGAAEAAGEGAGDGAG